MDTHSPLISIITITYNAAEEIPATILSLNAQDFRDFEHIVIDGASSDQTITIARTLPTNPPRILSEPDNGLYDAMNKGLKLAKGKYILFLNAGDSFHDSDSLSSYAEKAILNPDIIYGDTVIVDKERNIIRPRHLSAPEKLTFKSFSHGMLICHQAFMVRREIAPLFNLKYRFSADYDWTIKCILASNPDNFINLHKVTIDFLENGTTDKNKKASLMERFHIMAAHYGKAIAVSRHLSFIPRALARKFIKSNYSKNTDSSY